MTNDEWSNGRKKDGVERRLTRHHSSFVIRHCLALGLALTLVARAAEPIGLRPTFHSSLKTASEAAAPAQSLVLLVFIATWCGFCKALKKNTLEAKEFVEGGGPVCV